VANLKVGKTSTRLSRIISSNSVAVERYDGLSTKALHIGHGHSNQNSISQESVPQLMRCRLLHVVTTEFDIISESKSHKDTYDSLIFNYLT
jgi:hypothetical protein